MTSAEGIGAFVRRFSHVVVNVTDLERSIAFYEAVSVLRCVATFDVPEQDLAPLPIDAARGSARGAVLVDQTGGDPVAVHLVQWLSPGPVGAPMSTFLGHGYVKLAITYPDAASKRAQLAAAGVELTNAVTVRNYLSVVDPDGVIISFLQADASPTERLYHTCLSTISVEETTEFYRDVLGLDHWIRATVPTPVPASQGPGPDVARVRLQLLPRVRRPAVPARLFEEPARRRARAVDAAGEPGGDLARRHRGRGRRRVPRTRSGPVRRALRSGRSATS